MLVDLQLLEKLDKVSANWMLKEYYVTMQMEDMDAGGVEYLLLSEINW